MSRIKDGGPAFPLADSSETDDCKDKGMSLRDWLAGQALTGICANETWSWIYSDTARDAYRLADECLAAREVKR